MCVVMLLLRLLFEISWGIEDGRGRAACTASIFYLDTVPAILSRLYEAFCKIEVKCGNRQVGTYKIRLSAAEVVGLFVMIRYHSWGWLGWQEV